MPFVRSRVEEYEHPELKNKSLPVPCEASCCRRPPSGVCEDETKFRVNLDVQQFLPEELTVRASEGSVVIEGHHEEREDEHGVVSRHFVRRYSLPKDVELEDAQCQISSDGILCICVPKKAPTPVEGPEKIVPITHTHLPAPFPTAIEAH